MSLPTSPPPADSAPGPARVLGIDPGLNVTGYAVVDARGGRFDLIEAGVVRSRRGDSLESRLAELFDGVKEVLDQHRPAFMAMEQLFSHYARPKTAILMGHARGVICLAAAHSGIAVESFEPTKIKKAMTGNGHAPKDQIQQAVKVELNLTQVPEPADVADALAIAICGYQLNHNPLYA